MGLFAKSEAVVGVRAVHLDLKGTPPTIERLLSLLDVFAAARYNGVLVEWEDMFPWSVDKRFSSETAYSKQEVEQFHSKAESLGIQIIPLVQCLGHMETPLSLPEYVHLREVAHKPDVLNPLAEGARELVEKMVDDVLSLTPGAKYLHLGGDEAWSFGTHVDTKAYIEEHGKGALYLHHIEPILDSLNARGVRPILWHDMMCHWDDEALARLAGKADLCVWGYVGHPDATDHHFNSKYTERFREQGVTCWAGAAYKGADGMNIDLPNLAVREENALGWMEVAERYGFVGAIATAWSRYNTGTMQCEPIDGSLDSLVNVGVIMHDGASPAGGMESCEQLLEQIGEKERFDGSKQALKKFTDERKAAWRMIQETREMLALLSGETNRAGCQNETVKKLQHLTDCVCRLGKAAKEVESSLEGLMQELWVKRYILVRLEPICDELAMLEKLVQKACPEFVAAESKTA